MGREGREEQFLIGFLAGLALCVPRGQLWRGHPTLTTKRFSEKSLKGLALLGTDKTGENKAEGRKANHCGEV